MGMVVCVTGASGFIASWLVKLLLQRGYTVNATVRNIGDSSKVDHLRTLEGAKERLFLFEAELLEQGSFDAAVNGCHGVFHTASPVMFRNITDPQNEVIEPAVEGTLNVLRSCAKVSSLKRVVLTSSMASIMCSERAISGGAVIDESWFSDPEFCRQHEQWYMLSKILAEEAAMKFAQENALDIVTINPGLTIGPLLQPSINFSSGSFLFLLIHGKEDECGMALGQFVFVDVRDVAEVHILAFEKSSAKGRYCLVGEVVTVFDTLKIIHKLYPSLLNHDSSSVSGEPEAPHYRVLNEKTKSLGAEFTSLERSVKDTIDDLLEKKLINLNS